MADQNGSGDAKLAKRLTYQSRLGLWSPDGAARPLVVSEARPVEHDGAMVRRDQVKHAADDEIVGQRAVAVQQDDGRANAAHNVVQPHPVHFDEAAGRRMTTLGAAGDKVVRKRRSAERGSNCQHLCGRAAGRRAASPRRAQLRERRHADPIKCWLLASGVPPHFSKAYSGSKNASSSLLSSTISSTRLPMP